MTESMTEAIHDLVNPWTDVVQGDRRSAYRAVDHEPLLTMLTIALRSSTGRTTSGRNADGARNPINLQAFALIETITRDVRMFTRRHTRDNPNPMLGAAIRTLAGTADALWATHKITETDYLHMIRKAHTWRASIWQMFDPPVERELTEPCPANECGQRHVFNTEGEQQSALVVTHRTGQVPVARCRSCGTIWQGEAQLLILGRMIGAEVNVEALEEMGAA